MSDNNCMESITAQSAQCKKAKEELVVQLNTFLNNRIGMDWIQESRNYLMFLWFGQLFEKVESQTPAFRILKRLKKMRGGALASEDVYWLKNFVPGLLELFELQEKQTAN